ncbi:MAG: Lrp/AsnC family transcriptional regulator [Candidatus Hydrothermarchaeales archaeon]
MKIVLDKLDREIVRHVSSGVLSYRELGHLCNVGRNTIYRRMRRLENLKVIEKKIMAMPNFMKLDLSAIAVMMDVMQTDVEKTISFLKRQNQVKFLWKTFGSHNVTAVIICNKGEEGQCISKLRGALERMRVETKKFDTSISITWEKVDLTPY